MAASRARLPQDRIVSASSPRIFQRPRISCWHAPKRSRGRRSLALPAPVASLPQFAQPLTLSWPDSQWHAWVARMWLVDNNGVEVAPAARRCLERRTRHWHSPSSRDSHQNCPAALSMQPVWQHSFVLNVRRIRIGDCGFNGRQGGLPGNRARASTGQPRRACGCHCQRPSSGCCGAAAAAAARVPPFGGSVCFQGGGGGSSESPPVAAVTSAGRDSDKTRGRDDDRAAGPL